MKSIMGTVIINSPKVSLRYFCSYMSLREKKSTGGSFWQNWSDERLQAHWKSWGHVPSNMPVLNTILFGNRTTAKKLLMKPPQTWPEKKACNTSDGHNESDSALSGRKPDSGDRLKRRDSKTDWKGRKGLNRLLSLLNSNLGSKKRRM